MKSGIEQEAAALRRALVSYLTQAGSLVTPEWREAFLSVPRHLFVPCFYQWRTDRYVLVSGRKPAHRDQWLRTIYDDTSLTTAVDSVGAPMSSSTQPSVMAMMLEALTMTEHHHRVLEIGTGTGYNAALLCHRLDANGVTSIEVAQELLAPAKIRLAALGYTPSLAVADGVGGYAAKAPYDRLISTCRVAEIPAAWLTQLVPGAVVVASIGIGIARLVVTEPGFAIGRFLPAETRFLPMRAMPSRDSPARRSSNATGVGDKNDPAWNRVVQWWHGQGSPDPARLGITATKDGTSMWLDTPAVQFPLRPLR